MYDIAERPCTQGASERSDSAERDGSKITNRGRHGQRPNGVGRARLKDNQRSKHDVHRTPALPAIPAEAGMQGGRGGCVLRVGRLRRAHLPGYPSGGWSGDWGRRVSILRASFHLARPTPCGRWPWHPALTLADVTHPFALLSLRHSVTLSLRHSVTSPPCLRAFPHRLDFNHERSFCRPHVVRQRSLVTQPRRAVSTP